MAEVIIRSELKEGDKIEISFDKEKDEIVMNAVHAPKEQAATAVTKKKDKEKEKEKGKE
jgi:hypothetical protein